MDLWEVEIHPGVYAERRKTGRPSGSVGVIPWRGTRPILNVQALVCSNVYFWDAGTAAGTRL